MTTRLLFLFVLLATASTPRAQTPPRFEVASVRPSPETMKDYLAIAFNDSPKQIVGPDWIDEVRFEVNAPIPAASVATSSRDASGAAARALSDILICYVDRTVIDTTGLTGRYDITAKLTREEDSATLLRSAVNAGIRLPPQVGQMLDPGPCNPVGPALEAAGLGARLPPRPRSTSSSSNQYCARRPRTSERCLFRAINSISVNTQPFLVDNQSGSPSDHEG